jgi:1-acyl-sn-glycerol-3-phosphate acyltransferase
MQVISYLVLTPIIRVVVRANCWLPKNIRNLNRGALLIANHRSKSDPFVVLAHLPISVFMRILPVRFPVDHDFMRRKRFRWTLPLVGAYDIGGTARERMLGLLRTKEYLDRNTTVFLFPEGRIHRQNVGEFQKGLEFFLGAGRRIVLIRIDGLERASKSVFRHGNTLHFSTVLSVSDEKRIEASALRAIIETS